MAERFGVPRCVPTTVSALFDPIWANVLRPRFASNTFEGDTLDDRIGKPTVPRQASVLGSRRLTPSDACENPRSMNGSSADTSAGNTTTPASGAAIGAYVAQLA